MKEIKKVEQAECPRGGNHTEGVRAVKGNALMYCLKCLRPSTEIDLELNGPRN